MTPLSPVKKILGYLFGLPAREYFMFFLTVPFVIYAVIAGEVRLITMAQIYFVFLLSVLLYHLTGFVAGMINKKPKHASMAAQGIVLILYLFLPKLSQLGFTFFAFLTPLPTYEAIAAGIVNETSKQAILSESGAVPFFTITMNPTFYTFMIQGLFIVSLFAIIYRKWIRDSNHIFSKEYAIIGYSVLQFLLIGSLWPFIVGQEVMPSFLAMMNDKIQLIVLIYIFLFISGITSVFILNVIIPSRFIILKGLRRARKKGMKNVNITSDASSGLPYSVILIIITSISYFVLMNLLKDGGRFSSKPPSVTAMGSIILLFALMIFYAQSLRESVGMRGFFIISFVLWVIPFFAFLILITGWGKLLIASYVSISSPVTFFLFAIQNMYEGGIKITEDGALTSHVKRLTNLAIAINMIVAIVGLVLLKKYRARIHKEAGFESQN